MRLIDADALAQALHEAGTVMGQPHFLCRTVYECINNAPIVDAVPVRHGRWIKNDPHCDGLAFLWNCSKCGAESEEGYRYCPACGARMDAKE